MSVSSLPLVQWVLDRMGLEEFLLAYLPHPRQAPRVAYAKGIALLVRNILLSREPMYGVGDWAEEFAPDLLGLRPKDIECLNDDRVGRCLDKLFLSDVSSLTLAVTSHVVREFNVDLDELHNDSTTVTFHGQYDAAIPGARRLGKETRSITWGHNKDHRPDLKQLLFILTASRDGGVPLYFTVGDGNLTDDQTHCATWDLLRQLTGRPDFLYVADCKLATRENMAHVHDRGGRFITVLPRTRAEDRQFRERVRKGAVSWKSIVRRTDREGIVIDEVSVCEQTCFSDEGFRVFWYHSSRKSKQDRATRQRTLDKAAKALQDLQERMLLPRSRYRKREKVEHAVESILAETGTAAWFQVRILESEESRYRQVQRGRPGPETHYRRTTRLRFDLDVQRQQHALDHDAATDGTFPIITNDLKLSAKEAFAAYKRQPVIEKRFSQLKSELEIAPVYLHAAGRVEALLCVYYFALLTQTLLEREIRHRMVEKGVSSIPLYHENRACKAPSARRILDAFGGIQRHSLRHPGGDKKSMELVTELNPLQIEILRLLDLSPENYGRKLPPPSSR
jgi:transposase